MEENISVNSSTPGDDLIQSIKLSGPLFLVKMSVISLVIVFNVGFVALLWKNWKILKWKRYAFVAHLAVADIVMGLCLLTVLLLCLMNRATVAVLVIMDIAVSGSIGTNMLSYSGLLWIQYYAVRRPLQYKTGLTRTKVVAVICFIWINLLCYCITRYYFLTTNFSWKHAVYVFQIACLTLSLLTNTAVYVYILYVSMKQKVGRKNYGSQQNSFESSGSHSPLRKSVSGSRKKETFGKRYRFVLTTGISLVLYWVTVVPFYVCSVKLRLDNRWVVWYVKDPVFHITVVVLYSRAIFDPLIHICREPKLLASSSSSL